MSFFVFGLSHDSAPARVRDGFALDNAGVLRLLQQADAGTGAEFIVVSTCNRAEVWLYGLPEDCEAVRNCWSRLVACDWDPEYCFLIEDEEAVRHILHVTSSLDSLVLGDAQILAQIKAAYQAAVDQDRVGPVMHRLMHTAFRAAKRVVAETGVSNGAASVSTAAVAMALDQLDAGGLSDFRTRQVLIVGAGQMARLASYAVARFKPAGLTICNRSEARGEELARACSGRYIPWDDRYSAMAACDLVIVATGAPSPVLTAFDVRVPRSDVLIVDVATPRNVDPAIGHLSGYRLIDLDDLNIWIGNVNDARMSELPSAYAICDALLAEFVTWMFHQQALQPAIQAIRDTFERIRLQEIERHHHRFAEIDRDQLDVLTRSILQKVLSIPIVRLKDTNPDNLNFVNGIRLLEDLFSRPWCDDDQDLDHRTPAMVAEALPSLPNGLFHSSHVSDVTGEAVDVTDCPVHQQVEVR